MKMIQILGAILLLGASAHGQTTLVDAGRFIHLRTVDEGEQSDTYLRAEAIDAVAVFRSDREADKERPFKVCITTRILSTSNNGGEAWTTVNRSDDFYCVSRDEADRIATAIVKACSGDRTEKKAEQAGTGQPATRPESKSEGGDKPQPEAEGRSR
jgi:hypothetical protein